MDKLTKLWDPKKGVMKIAGLMSGSGSNLVKIIEHEQKLKDERGFSPYHVAVIFSDNPKSNAVKIGSDFALPVFTFDLEAYCRKIQADVKDMKAREDYEKNVINVINQFECPVFAYAGYMRKATELFVNSAIGVNIHPADLSIVDKKGKREYTGDKAVLKALKAGEKEIRSTTHLITSKVDNGPLLMVSRPVKIDYPISDDIIIMDMMAKHYQNSLKTTGDWEIFPKTLEYIAEGRYAKDIKGRLYFDEVPIFNGVRLD
ncbi:MAG: formyltransferase family protein [Candidatus Pacearchaeota archaeon]|jgi:folate-dependent phosphoribosylglycinamide formyltransferase PurN